MYNPIILMFFGAVNKNVRIPRPKTVFAFCFKCDRRSVCSHKCGPADGVERKGAHLLLPVEAEIQPSGAPGLGLATLGRKVVCVAFSEPACFGAVTRYDRRSVPRIKIAHLIDKEIRSTFSPKGGHIRSVISMVGAGHRWRPAHVPAIG
jgi:hypothetical protein